MFLGEVCVFHPKLIICFALTLLHHIKLTGTEPTTLRLCGGVQYNFHEGKRNWRGEKCY